MPDPNQKDNGTPPPVKPSAPQSNWGMWILIAVIAGILVLAFSFDGGSSAKRLTLDEFRHDFRSGAIVTNNPKEFPIEVTMSDTSSEASIRSTMEPISVFVSGL